MFILSCFSNPPSPSHCSPAIVSASAFWPHFLFFKPAHFFPSGLNPTHPSRKSWKEQLPRVSAPVSCMCCKTNGASSRNSQKQSSPDVQMTCICSKPWSVTFYAHLHQQIESTSTSISIFEPLFAAYLNIKGSITTYLSPRTVSRVRNGAFLCSALLSLPHVQQQVKQAHSAAAVKSHVGGLNSLVRERKLRGHKPR